MFLSFVFDELVSCLNDREEKNDLFRICLHGSICSFFNVANYYQDDLSLSFSSYMDVVFR